MVASQVGQLPSVECLLKEGASVHYRNAMGQCALLLACTNGKEAIVQLLLHAGAHFLLEDPLAKQHYHTFLFLFCCYTHTFLLMLIEGKTKYRAIKLEDQTAITCFQLCGLSAS